MTIKEVKELYKGQYDDIEVYSTWCVGEHHPNYFHTDNCKFTENFTDESEVGLYELMNEEDYNHSIMANTSDYADFEGLYGNKEAKVLCVMLADIQKDNDDESGKYLEEELEEVLSDFYESCIRTGHYNMEECAKYFCRENDHMNVDEDKVLEILRRIDEN